MVQYVSLWSRHPPVNVDEVSAVRRCLVDALPAGAQVHRQGQWQLQWQDAASSSDEAVDCGGCSDGVDSANSTHKTASKRHQHKDNRRMNITPSEWRDNRSKLLNPDIRVFGSYTDDFQNLFRACAPYTQYYRAGSWKPATTPQWVLDRAYRVDPDWTGPVEEVLK